MRTRVALISVLVPAGLACFLSSLEAQGNPAIAREGSYWVEVVKGEVPAALANRLKVNAEGAVTLRGEAGRSVQYTLKKRVRARSSEEARSRLRMFRMKTLREGDLLRVAFVSSIPQGLASDVSITAPSGLREVVVETQGGSVVVSDINGQVRVATAAGQVDLDRIQGACSARTGGGDMRVGQVGGSFQCFTGGGTIRVGSTGGEAKLETAGGDIFLEHAGGPVYAFTAGGNIHIDRSGSSVVARTGAGLIEVKDAGGPVTADTTGGAIQINSAHGARCASTAGAIRLRNVNGALRAETGTGNILAELLAGHAFEDSTLSASTGDVTVLIPSNIALTVVAQNQSAAALGRIVSDFPQIQVKPANMGLSGPAIARGSLNGGGQVLWIQVAAGNIYLRRQP